MTSWQHLPVDKNLLACSPLLRKIWQDQIKPTNHLKFKTEVTVWSNPFYYCNKVFYLVHSCLKAPYLLQSMIWASKTILLSSLPNLISFRSKTQLFFVQANDLKSPKKQYLNALKMQKQHSMSFIFTLANCW